MACASITEQQWIQMALWHIVMVIMMIGAVVARRIIGRRASLWLAKPINDIPLAKPNTFK
jgi:uncharacterized membrane protein